MATPQTPAVSRFYSAEVTSAVERRRLIMPSSAGILTRSKAKHADAAFICTKTHNLDSDSVIKGQASFTDDNLVPQNLATALQDDSHSAAGRVIAMIVVLAALSALLISVSTRAVTRPAALETAVSINSNLTEYTTVTGTSFDTKFSMDVDVEYAAPKPEVEKAPTVRNRLASAWSSGSSEADMQHEVDAAFSVIMEPLRTIDSVANLSLRRASSISVLEAVPIKGTAGIVGSIEKLDAAVIEPLATATAASPPAPLNVSADATTTAMEVNVPSSTTVASDATGIKTSAASNSIVDAEAAIATPTAPQQNSVPPGRSSDDHHPLQDPAMTVVASGSSGEVKVQLIQARHAHFDVLSGETSIISRYSLLVDLGKTRTHPTHSRLCGSLVPEPRAGQPVEASHLSQACMSPASTQLFASTLAASGTNSVDHAFVIDNMQRGINYAVTVTIMDVRGRMVRVALKALVEAEGDSQREMAVDGLQQSLKGKATLRAAW